MASTLCSLTLSAKAAVAGAVLTNPPGRLDHAGSAVAVTSVGQTDTQIVQGDPLRRRPAWTPRSLSENEEADDFHATGSGKKMDLVGHVVERQPLEKSGQRPAGKGLFLGRQR